MRIFLLFIFFIISTFIIAQSNDIRVMTYNIRYASERPGEEWSVRKFNVAEMIRFHKPDIFCLQEVLKLQIDFLENSFQNYSRVGVGRDDGKEEGEFSPIFFSTRFTLLRNETFWLSTTPDIPSKGWDAGLNRIVSNVMLLDSYTNDTVSVYNTHFDHVGKVAREKSSELIVQKMKNVSENNAKILVGDFNVTDTARAYSILNNSILKDASEISKISNYGTSFTFNGFNHDKTDGRKIDYIFVNPKVKVLHHAVIGDKFEGQYPSDHMPVILDFTIKE